MKTPFYAIAVNDASEMTFTHVIGENHADPLGFSIPLNELNSDGLETACRRVGEMVFGVMAHWYPGTFAHFPNLKMPFNAQLDLDLISELISKSVEDKTQVHIASIDFLIKQLIAIEPSAADEPVIKTWKDVQSMLERIKN